MGKHLRRKNVSSLEKINSDHSEFAQTMILKLLLELLIGEIEISEQRVKAD